MPDPKPLGSEAVNETELPNFLMLRIKNFLMLRADAKEIKTGMFSSST